MKGKGNVQTFIIDREYSNLFKAKLLNIIRRENMVGPELKKLRPLKPLLLRKNVSKLKNLGEAAKTHVTVSKSSSETDLNRTKTGSSKLQNKLKNKGKAETKQPTNEEDEPTVIRELVASKFTLVFSKDHEDLQEEFFQSYIKKHWFSHKKFLVTYAITYVLETLIMFRYYEALKHPDALFAIRFAGFITLIILAMSYKWINRRTLYKIISIILLIILAVTSILDTTFLNDTITGNTSDTVFVAFQSIDLIEVSLTGILGFFLNGMYFVESALVWASMFIIWVILSIVRSDVHVEWLVYLALLGGYLLYQKYLQFSKEIVSFNQLLAKSVRKIEEERLVTHLLPTHVRLSLPTRPDFP
jgi:hypothetical protein